MTLVETLESRRWNQQRLTNSALINLEYIQPPAELVPYVTTFFRLRCDEPEIADMQPASVGILAVFLCGEGNLLLPNGQTDASHPTSLLTPLSAAAPMLVRGPWDAFGASLSPLGWAALTGRLNAAQYGNRLVEAGSLLGHAVRDVGAQMIADHAIAPLENETMLARMSSVLAGSLSRVPPAHAVLIRAVSAWLGESLSPRVEDLQAHVLYSPRQLQRLVDHYFGLPPKQLARKYRALRAMALLADPGIDEQAVDSIVSLFHDVAHLRRELQLFVGRTPPYIGSNDLPLNAAQLDLHNFREIGHPVARIPKSHAR